MPVVEVLGPEPPCPRCTRTLEVVEQAVSELRLECDVKKTNTLDRATVAKYGIVFTPAVAVDGKVSLAGRVPSVDEMKALLLAATRLPEERVNRR